MEYLIQLSILILTFIIGFQISINDLLLLRGNINYKKKLTNYTAYIALIITIAIIINDIIHNGIIRCILAGFIIGVYSMMGIWLLSKINLKSFWNNSIILAILIGINVIILDYFDIILYSTAIFWALYYRNAPFGAPHRRHYLLFNKIRKLWYIENGENSLVIDDTDYSYAGKKKIFKDLCIYNVADYDIFPNGEDVLPKVQALIEKIGNKGGELYFPRGKYFFNKNSKKHKFLSINYSHIHLRGELSKDGKPLTILLNCNPTLRGNKNPWLSPFFITTGENIQQSNIFFGLQFLKKRNIITRSESMSDPGSDGTILTPDFITNIISDAKRGSDIIEVNDTKQLRGVQYIMIGMYNTDKDGNLIKEILGVNTLLPEWKTAQRAGEEQAPSFQWLIGIEEIIDKTKIRLTRPLLHDIHIKYLPKIFSAPMLEDICVKDLVIESKWNGLFRHHGYPRYYSVKQAQEMDYGWNAINIKRVAHGEINNVIIKNFTNPIYVMDSRNITTENVIIEGEDGHQGIKVYEHACDNLFKHIVFYNHYADMIGGEGNAYGNVFNNISYLNPYFKPVDYDFHGFSEGPMSPPAYNLFINIYGFRNVKGAGAKYNQPACARYNAWINCYREGNYYKEPLFYNIHYLNKIPRKEHKELFKDSIITNMIE